MRSRGFTVIEVMMALGLLSVIVALVLPVVADRVTSRDLDRVAGDVAGALALARSTAQETGVPVAVRARRAGDLWTIEQRPVDAASLAPLLQNQAGAPTPSDAPDAPAWGHLLEIPAAFVVARWAPTSEAPNPIDLREPAPLPSEFPDTDRILAGVFLPGGRCIGAGELFLSIAPEEPGRSAPAVRLTISAWTGAVIAERVETASDAALPSDEQIAPPVFDAPPGEPGP